MASIQWTDATGAAELTHAHDGTVGSRFRSWTPVARAHGVKAHEMESRTRHAFIFGQVYGARFAFDAIPHTNMALMDRLVRHLDGGGTVTVVTDDASSRTYTCCLAPEADLPDPELSDAVLLHYTMAFDLVNVAASPSAMIVTYP